MHKKSPQIKIINSKKILNDSSFTNFLTQNEQEEIQTAEEAPSDFFITHE